MDKNELNEQREEFLLFDLYGKTEANVGESDLLDGNDVLSTKDGHKDTILESDLLIEVDESVIDEKSVKIYWTDDTEQGIIDFLYLNEFFYENMIKQEIEEAAKQKRIVNKFYCNEMQRRMNEVVEIEDRIKTREKIFREKIETPLKKLVENILFNYKLFLPGIDIKTQQKDCYTFIYLKFTNFNPWKRGAWGIIFFC